ncbi:MAG TPA: DUF4878 domain-containing protein [Ignavibacteria bacterium]|nr:DUF4878 domain-containing protein [Ignavibacteria bacterium]
MKIILTLIISFYFISCGSPGGSDSPANAIKDFVTAVKEGNPAKAWTILSKDSQKLYEDMAKNRNQSGQEFFVGSMKDAKALGILGNDFQVMEEIKEGDDKAIVNVMTMNGETQEMYTIKENGTWHLDYARTMEESRKLVE